MSHWKALTVADAREMRALSIRQPYAEQILRGVKKIEYRSRAPKIIGERFYIDAAGKKRICASDNRIG